MSALGFIETKGLIAAIESADAMLKSADVRLLEKTQVGAGLVTITVTGEVSAVNASIDAAIAAVKQIKGATLISGHVIARPDAELEKIMIIKSKPGKAVEPRKIPEPEKPGKPENIAKPEKASPVKEDALKVMAKPQLKKMNVSKLRQIARGFDGFPIAREKIKFARKKELIEAIMNSYKQEEE